MQSLFLSRFKPLTDSEKSSIATSKEPQEYVMNRKLFDTEEYQRFKDNPSGTPQEA